MYHHHLYVYLGGPNTAKTTTTTLETHPCLSGEPFLLEDHGPTCVAPNWAVDTTQNATQTPESPTAVQAIHTKTTAGTGAATATGGCPPDVRLDNVRKRSSSALGSGGSTLLSSARDDVGKEDEVSLVRTHALCRTVPLPLTSNGCVVSSRV